MPRRSLTLAALFALALAAHARPAIASEQLQAVVASYLQVQALLASDKLDGVKAPAQEIVKHATAMGPDGAAIVKAAKSVEAAPDLQAARDAFKPLSEAVIAAANAAGWSDLGDVKLAFCPMAMASWLQKEEKIRNPYYGSSMLTCGEFKPRAK